MKPQVPTEQSKNFGMMKFEAEDNVDLFTPQGKQRSEEKFVRMIITKKEEEEKNMFCTTKLAFGSKLNVLYFTSVAYD